MSVKQISSFGSSSEPLGSSGGTSVPAGLLKDGADLAEDGRAKAVFSFKEIMGYIISKVLPEFKGMHYKEAMEYFVGSEGSPKVELKGSESINANGREIRRDLKFRVRNPEWVSGGDKYVSVYFHVDFEMQKDRNPGYSIVRRGVYYCARAIDEQLVKGDDYDSLEKVYGIWVVPDATEEKKNSIDCYRIKDQYNEMTDESDLMGLYFLWLDKKPNETEEIKGTVFGFLQAMFSGKNVKEKISEYIVVSDGLGKAVDEMSGYTEFILERGLEQGREEGREEGIKGTIKALKAMGADYDIILEQIKNIYYLSGEEAEKYLDKEMRSL